ncbi:receptor-type tyrosine-protein phosphatase S-like isoform X2 [Montipora capricornis]|uniref:receptor-type tyrosine-protein phosphatase S-like isoform X2 n=1 Tax=Montipora capricornis TaxID=246305 RepID=UPI0035F13DC1
MFTSRQKMSIMVGDTSYCKALCFQVIFCLLLAHLSSESCEKDALGLEKGFILDGQITSSSDLSPNTPAKNGRLNYTAGSSWCASPSDSFPYLEIDLQSLHIICAVSTQGNSKADQWVKTYSLQSSTDGATWTNYTARGQIGFKSFSGNFNRNTIVKHVLYHGMVGRYVRFVAGSKHVQACLRTEIFGASRRDIKGNVALFKPTDQKSTRGSFFSSYAVDGGKGTNVRFCAHTGDAGNTNPFWRVDLGRVEHVAEVRILNRDCCADRLDGAEIRVGDSTAMGGATNHVCATVTRIPVKEEKQFFCKPIASGRYVSIRIAGHPKDVVICEVEVYSTFTHNLALNQPAEQVSIAHGGVASRAVDGDRRTNYPSGTCTHTDFAKDAWWRVDLGASVPVAEVVIVNRYCRPQLECVAFMDSFQIKIGNNTSTNTGCGGTLSMVTGETKSFYCYPPIVGRYVSVVVPGVRKILTICEVEVYSTPQTSNGVTACRANPVGISNSTVICNHRFSASSSLGSSFLPSKGRFNGASAWIPSSTNNNTDYLQIDLGSVYFVCAVATQGNPSADDWTKTYKIETSLDNANWQMYQENNTVKIFSGNSGQNFSVKSDFYNPLAVKFIRFYPVAFNSRKALRVEVYGSTQGCLSTVGNERGVDPRPFSVTASSELDGTHTQAHSHLYGITSWCSRVVAPPQYLQFDFGKVITVSGIATQGDDVVDKWVTGYGISYGYDGRSWLSYNIGQPLIGNVDRRSVVVRWFSLPFAAQFVRILPKTYHNGLCMRVELFGCKDFQIAFLFVHVDDGTLLAANSATITLNCVTKSSKKLPRAISYEWRKNGVKLDESSSSLTIKYSDASDINNNYRCARLNSSRRQVQCHAIYQCSASLETDAGAPYITSQGNSTVTVTLQVPGKPTVGVTTIGARTAIVTWSYTPGVDEAPVNSFTLQYQTHTFIILPGSSSRKELTNLKPCTSYSVTIKASSVLGDGFWSDAKNFTTATALPEISPQVVDARGITSQTIYVEWKKPSFNKLNGPFARYTIGYRESGKSQSTVSVPGSETSNVTLSNLKKWTDYLINIRVENRDHQGPWSTYRQVKTKQDAPGAPQNLRLKIDKPSENTRPRMTVTWDKPAEENGIMKIYTLDYSFDLGGGPISHQYRTNSRTFSYTFDVLGGIEYTVGVTAETIKPGPSVTKVQLVPVYKPSISPRNITSQKMTEKSFNISWNALSRRLSNGYVIAYEVMHTRKSKSGVKSAPDYQNTTTTTSVTLSDLSSCSQYSVYVRAYTSAGPGPFGALPSRIVTNAPSPPSDVKAGPADKRSITLSWKKPKISGDDVQMYTVIFKGTKSYYPDFTDSRTVKTKALSKEFTNLYPGTKYDFVVFATTHCGNGDNSSMVTTHTLIAAPAAPKNPVETQKFDPIGSSVNLTIWPADQDNGPISYYQVLVHRVEDWTDKISEWNDFGPDFYVSAQIPASAVNPSMTFVLGDGGDIGGFTNKKLSRGQKYNVYSRATTAKSKKRSTDEQFLTGAAKLLAQIDVKAVASNQGNKSVEKSSPVAAITSVVVIVVLVGVVIAGVVIWRRRRRQDERSSKTNESHPMTEVSFNDAYDTVRPEGGGSRPRPPSEEEPGETVEATADPIYGNTAADDLDDKPKPIPVSQFSEYVTQLKREKNAGFAKQYKLLAPGQQFSWDDAKKPGNKNKNRYANIIAYDHSRVILPIIDGSENSDYMNASYLHGYDGTPKTYIACQGPVPGTYQDFWRMIWQENATTIVMLTRLVEHGRTKCHQYWPEKSESYHDVIVRNHKTETFADYAIRTFILSKKGSEDKRQVQQFHFLVWPDKGVPRHATAVLGLRRKVRMKHHDNRTPLVVHCSAGVGRTGAFIVIDAMLESIKKKKVVDVFNYVQLLRNNRISMVQTEEQYGFIYMALLESVTCGNTEIAAHDIRIAVKKLAAVNPKTKTSGLASEYQRLNLITADDVTDIEDDIGRKHENASKNRFPDIIPLNGSRVVLKDGRSDYINAAFVDTFRERNSFIMTQAPLDNTIEDFWKMIWDYDIGTIVTLNEPKERGQVYPVYWASEGSTTFGEFTIETTSHEVFQDFSERELTVKRKKDPNTVRQIHQYQVTGWPDKGVPKNAHCIIDLINMVERSQRKTSNAPLVVQCSDGVGRSGTFCAILSIIERLKSEQVIDVFQSVKVIRVNRPKAVNCKAQYVFCYNIVQRYLDSFNDYSNFN